ncbi:MAG: AraC family transcriptional regulator [Victivallaceae bacterium]|nr:AraC family transcriptional regulator [Victivallaceae bacterium]
MQNGINVKHRYPQRIVWRTIGPTGAPSRLGAGFMHKTRAVDFVDFDSPRYVLVAVLAGAGRYVDDSGAEYRLEPGMLFQRIPGRRQSNYIAPESGWYECYLETGMDFAAALNQMGVIDWSHPVRRLDRPAEFADLVHAFMTGLAVAREETLPAFAVQLAELFRLAFFPSARTESGPEPPDGNHAIDAARRRLESGFDRPFDLHSFCREHNCGYEYFRKKFKAVVGLPPLQYRIKRRLDTAAELLTARTLPVSEIAALLGYSSPYEFSAQFKRAFGRSPKYFRAGAEGKTKKS